MNWFDLTVLRSLTSFANVWPAFDRFTSSLVSLELVKGGVTMALFWAAWFGRGSDERRREILVATLAAAAAALFVAVALAMLLPFRLRPLLVFQAEGMIVSPSWRDWSSFPSDHATLFLALATGIQRAVPRVGWIALGHALVIVCLPRVYIGLHYPTDILGGATLGVAATYFFTGTSLRRRVSAWPLALSRRSPGAFYAALFVASYLIATLFTDLRQAGLWLYGYVSG